MNHWYDLSTINDDKLKTFHAEAAREQLAREVQGRQSWPGRFFNQVLLFVLVTLGLAGK
jgi:hypothetical protein